MLGRRAFICYTRADKTAALKVQRALMRLAGPVRTSAISEISNAQTGDFTMGPVLCAQIDTLSLSKTVRLDLEASDWLILVSSPAARTRAMETAAMVFKARGHAHRIIPVVTAGEPAASRTPGMAHRECLPRPLLFATDANGALTDHPVTPATVDMRSDGLSVEDAAAHIAARITGTPVIGFQAVARKYRRRNNILKAAVAVAALVALTIAPVLQRDITELNRVEAARAAGMAAHQALDQGQGQLAIATLTKAFPRDFPFTAPPYPVPDEALSALSRTVLETRSLADLPAPTQDITTLIPSPDGALIAINTDAGAHLVDIGAGEAMPIYQAGPNAVSRVSPDGATLWTARFGEEARNQDGDAYAPLIFENVDLASGAISMAAAVQSLPPGGGAATISPDGARFAVDIGPGHTDRTLIAVFSREKQALAGVASLPADRAHIEFLTPDQLLLTTNPPNIFGHAPGLYLWNLAEDHPRVLRAPGRTPVCPGASGAPQRAIAAEIAAGRLPAADWSVSEDRSEVALLLPSLTGGSCILRWDAQTGGQKPPLRTPTTFRSLAFAIADGPYAAMPDNGDLTLINKHGETQLGGCTGAAHHFGGSSDPLILCEGEDATTLHHGYSGQRKWHGPALPALTAVSHDPLNQRLIMARVDGRITTWDAAERGYQIARTPAPVTLARADADHIAVLGESGPPSFFDPFGRLTEVLDPTLVARVQPGDTPQLLALTAIGASSPEDTCEAFDALDVIHRSDSPSGDRTAIETSDGLTIFDRATCLPLMRLTTQTVGSGPLLVSEDLLWAPLPGEVSVFPLTIPAAEALDSLHARVAHQEGRRLE